MIEKKLNKEMEKAYMASLQANISYTDLLFTNQSHCLPSINSVVFHYIGIDCHGLISEVQPNITGELFFKTVDKAILQSLDQYCRNYFQSFVT